MAKRVRDVMMPAQWAVPTTCPLPEAARLMRIWDVHEIFVVDRGALRGVLREIDIAVGAIASGRPPKLLTAADCHAPDAPRLAVDQPVDEALAYMRLHHLRRAPVVDNDQLVGAAWTNDLELATQQGDSDPGHHEEAPTMTTPLLKINATTHDTTTTLTVVGELDLSTMPLFIEAINRALDAGAGADGDRGVDVVTIDAALLTYADSSAVQALLQAQSAANENETKLLLTNVHGSLARTLALCGMDQTFAIIPA